MTDKAPERIWVLPDYDDHTNPVSDDWSFGTWDATPSTSSATPYVPATALEAAQARIAKLEAERDRLINLTEKAQGHALHAQDRWATARAEALEEAAVKAEREGVYPELNVWDGGPDWYKHGKRIAAAIRALKEKPNG